MNPGGNVPVAGPWVTDLEVGYVTDAARNGWYAGAGEYPKRFEDAMARYAKRRVAVSLPSCTSGLHLALAALDIGPGDEVIVPDISWIASSAPIDYVGATPVFADVDPDSWCLSAPGLAAALTPRTRAVIAVDLYGNMPDYDALAAVLARHHAATGQHVALIEDAAEAVGATYKGRPAGAFGIAGVFSFHGSKTVTTGEGGMLLADDDAFIARVNILRDHGRQPGDRFFFNGEVGFKYKMSALQAAFGLGQIERLDQLINRKRELMAWYREELGSADGVRLNTDPPHVHPAYWMITAIWDAGLRISKREMFDQLAAAGIDSRPFFHPLSSLPAYRDRPQMAGAQQRHPVSYDLASRAINLPSALMLTRAQVARACEAFRAVLARRGAPAARVTA